MRHCPICRALLNGASTCRRCRADLTKVQAVEQRGRRLAGAALHALALGRRGDALRLLRRAYGTCAAPELLVILRHLRARG
jgi:hypothetical protein